MIASRQNNPIQVMSEGDQKIALTLEQEFELEMLRAAVEGLTCENAKRYLMETLKVTMIQKNAIDELARLISEVSAIASDRKRKG
jgi:PHD/YefM family antitoxin component YafN of YafNO toxin-antitoxin module